MHVVMMFAAEGADSTIYPCISLSEKITFRSDRRLLNLPDLPALPTRKTVNTVLLLFIYKIFKILYTITCYFCIIFLNIFFFVLALFGSFSA